MNSGTNGRVLTWWLARQNRQRTSLPPDTSGSGLRLYEAMKRDWISQNPDATGYQYERAMREIARECGV